MDYPNERTRTVTWDNPTISAEAARSMSGMEFLQAMLAGKVPRPPISHSLGFELVEVTEGRAVFVCTPDEYHYNPIGVVHGGLAATLLDSALGVSIHSALPAGAAYTTIELHVNYLRPLTATTGLVRAEAEVVHIGRSLATAQARIIDRDGKLYAHGTCTCMIFRSDSR
ncbi:MAG: PaaI family thioesterase [Anaerolineae bacterium]